jgi:hypothetical protein
MRKKVFVATEYLTDYFEATSSEANAILDSIKIALLLYDNIDLDVNEVRYQEIIGWITSELPNSDSREDLRNSVRINKTAFSTLKFEPNFDTSLIVGAAYEAICEKEPSWYEHWPVGILRAQELAISIISYEFYCGKFGCEFYTSLEHNIIVDKVLNRIKNGFSKNGPAQHLLESIRSFKYPYTNKSKFEEVDLAFKKAGATFEKLADTIEARPINLKSTNEELSIVFTNVRQKLFLPNPSELSWANIFKLRKSPYRKSFLEKAFADFNSSSKTDVNMYLLDHIYDLLDMRKPKIIKNIASRTVSNIPVPIIGINPYSIISSTVETVKDIKELKNFGWAYFIAEANLLKNK